MQRGAGSPLGRAIVALSLFCMAAAAALLVLSGRGVTTLEAYVVFFLPLTLSAVTLVLAFMAERLLYYYLALAGRVLMFLLTMPSAANAPAVGFFLLAGVLVEVGCFEPYPASLVEALGIAACAFALCLLKTAGDSADRLAWIERQLPLLVFGTLVSLFGCHMTRFREMVVDLRRDKERMTNSVVQLTRANSSYQDFAVRAQESATEKERQRITRDIHDVVGYTLTNNIMLLEAAMDLMQENPLALPTILETARTNAEEGLVRVRSAMYQLRRQETTYPRGVEAIHRLARLFEQATSIRVRCEFANLPWTFSERVDSTLYHLVQECLVNAFRHSQASEVRVVFWHDGGIVRMHISDNGVGAADITEGIGIRGMRERVEGMGGSLQVASRAYGFSVGAVIPVGAESHEV